MPENPPYLTPQIEALVDAAIAAQFDSIRTATLPHMGGGMKGEHFAKEFCTLYVGGMRRIGATQALVGLMERYPDAMAIFPNQDLLKFFLGRLPKDTKVRENRLDTFTRRNNVVSMRDMLREHWNQGGASANRYLVFVDCGTTGPMNTFVESLQKAVSSMGAPFFIVLIG